MKRKHRQYLFEINVSREDKRQSEQFAINRPLKSPSPDKKAANIIASTSSPDLKQIKKQITPIRVEPTASRILDKIEQRQKHLQHGTTPKQNKQSADATHIHKNEDTMVSSKKRTDERQLQVSRSHHRNYSSYERAYNQQNEMGAEYSPEDFLAESRGRLTNSELDYARMLREKQETIRQLRELIEMINRNGDNMSESGDDFSQAGMLQKKLKEYRSQLKIFQIQNQKLISVIENNHVNINSNKEEILQREIRELRETLKQKDAYIQQMGQDSQSKLEIAEIKVKQLHHENEQLIRALRNKDQNDKLPPDNKYNPERLTISKIKQQYNQNLRLSRQKFVQELQSMSELYEDMFTKMTVKLDKMTRQMIQLQQKEDHITERLRQKGGKRDQPPQIQSLMLEKYSQYQKQLNQEKKHSQHLELELSRAQKNIQELQLKSFNYSQEFSIQRQNEEEALDRLKKQNAQLSNRLKNEEEEIAKLKMLIEQIRRQKDLQKSEIQEKMLTFIDMYEQKLRVEKDKYDSTTEKMRGQIDQSRQNELRNRQELMEEKKDIEQKLQTLVAYYDQEISSYRAMVSSRQAEHQRVIQKNQQIKHQIARINSLKTCESQEFKTLSEEYDFFKRKCADLETSKKYLDDEINKLIHQMRDSERQRYELAKQRDQLQQALQDARSQILNMGRLQQQNQELRSHLSQISLQNSQFFSKLDQITRQLRESNTKIAVLEQQLQRRETLLDDVKQQLLTKQQELEELRHFYRTFKQDKSSFSFETLEGQLADLKKLINFQLQGSAIKFQEEIIQKHLILQNDYQLKLQQNMKLQQEIIVCRQQIGRQHRQKLALAQKIINLEKNIGIYEQELRERKGLYEQLLHQKTRIQKEILLSKKIKVSQQQQQSCQGEVACQIATRIDRILTLQRQRNQSLKRLFEKQQPFYYSTN